MKEWVCTVCDYVYEGENAPGECPQCGAPASKFKEQVSEEMAWACEYEAGMTRGAPEDIMMDLRANSEGECSKVGMYLAMSKVAHKEDYPEIGMRRARAVSEEAKHAAKFAGLLGEVVTSSTKKNLEMRAATENGAVAGKFDLAKRIRTLNPDAIHDIVHEMAKDEARHGKTFEGLLNRYLS